MSIAGEADRLAQDLFEARRQVRDAGHALHHDVGALLSAVGLKLQLLRMDHPDAREQVNQVLQTLDQAMERVRGLSQELLRSSPAATMGLKRALSLHIVERSASYSGAMKLSYAVPENPPDRAAVPFYETIAVVLDYAVRDRTATRIAISVRGGRNLTAQVKSNGQAKWPAGRLAAQARRARPAGISLEVKSKKSTIVSIRYADRRPPRG